MLVLGVNTSTDFLAISLINEKKILANYNSTGRLKHSDLLIPGIEKVLKKSGRKIKDIGLFSVGLGPGSFTGLRIGITAMRALAIALDKPIVGVPTLDAIAHNGFMFLKSRKLLDKYAKICPLLDAKRKQVYACIYGHDGAKITRKTDYLLRPASRLINHLRGSILFLGDAIPLYKEKFLHKKSFKAYFLDGKIWLPKASIIARMALEEYNKGRSDNPYDLVPLYLYARDCQVKR